MGTRKCLGSHFAELIMKYFIIHLLNTYSLDMPMGTKTGLEDTSMDTWVPIPDKKIAMRRRSSSVVESQFKCGRRS